MIASQIQQAVKALHQGDVVVFPTETVYGVGTDATNFKAVDRLFKVKQRPKDNPVSLHVSDIDMVKRIATVNEHAEKLMSDFWPGALALILNIKEAGSFASNVNNGGQTVGFRMPDNGIFLELSKQFGKPIAGTSANISGQLSSTSLSQVLGYFKNTISAFVDGGLSRIGIESTVIDLTQSIPTIIRSGSITKQQIEKALGVKIAEKKSEIAKKYKHYSVGKYVVAATADEIVSAQHLLAKNKFGVIARNDVIQKLDNKLQERSIILEDGIEEATRQLYNSINDMSSSSFVDGFVIEVRNEDIENRAFNNRVETITQGRKINEIIVHEKV
jgi:L-threonylcarbamoyladenylate synthase